MLNYARKLPRDQTGEAMQAFPPALPAKARYTNENNLVSSVISLSHDTTSVEITAVGATTVGRWVKRTDTAGSVIGIAGTTSDYDIVIPANTTRGFVVPIEVQGANMLASVVGLNREAGLYQRIAIKAQAIGSVLTVEY